MRVIVSDTLAGIALGSASTGLLLPVLFGGLRLAVRKPVGIPAGRCGFVRYRLHYFFFVAVWWTAQTSTDGKSNEEWRKSVSANSTWNWNSRWPTARRSLIY